ncbi:thioesterase family protein [Acinetobacter sichuanensis]|uniref:acyl-CoA thioesterase n=1 Tax=Acinetobacter sichuanensis TaxID=2136183 RepID=UPI0028106ECE|nr:thioesterase family protein [Acinetobacter sichuanensis]MDQ9023034.1 thioesterase family protein [Acinetobacter sichuanensis]
MNQFSEYPVIYKQNVAWGDMDAFGHVNNVQYYRYIESARIAYFDALQVFTEDVLTVVASSQCKYLKPVFYPDQLTIYTRIDEMRNSAIRMHYILWSEQQNQVVAEGEAVVVFVDKIEMKKMNIPTVLRERIINLENSVQHDLK